MISDEEIAVALRESGGNKALAFVKLERILRQALRSSLDELDERASNAAWTSRYIDYMNHTVATARFCDVIEISDYPIPSHTSSLVSDTYQTFTAAVDNFSMQVRLAAAEHQAFFSVRLKPEDKKKIRHYADKIKTVIDGSGLGKEKRDELFKLLDDFLVAVDREQTGLQYWGAFAAGVAHIVGEAAKELDPLRPWIESIARIFGKAQEDEPKRLPSPTTKQIEAPKKRLTDGRSRKIDDDIPF